MAMGPEQLLALEAVAELTKVFREEAGVQVDLEVMTKILQRLEEEGRLRRYLSRHLCIAD
jgi:hypothetical protein